MLVVRFVAFPCSEDNTDSVVSQVYYPPFQGLELFVMKFPRVLATLEPWAEISQRLRRFFKLNSSESGKLPGLFYKFCKQTLCFFGRVDAEFGVQDFFHSFEMLLNGRRLALGGERFHR